MASIALDAEYEMLADASQLYEQLAPLSKEVRAFDAASRDFFTACSAFLLDAPSPREFIQPRGLTAPAVQEPLHATPPTKDQAQAAACAAGAVCSRIHTQLEVPLQLWLEAYHAAKEQLPRCARVTERGGASARQVHDDRDFKHRTPAA
jgi:hypothetical protein